MGVAVLRPPVKIKKYHKMGGDHGATKVPDWRSYKVADIPQLVEYEKLLAQKGLKDPWIRNEVWRFQPQYFGTQAQRWQMTAFRGIKLGFFVFLGVVAVEKLVGAVAAPSHGHGHGHGHH